MTLDVRENQASANLSLDSLVRNRKGSKDSATSFECSFPCILPFEYDIEIGDSRTFFGNN